MVGQRFGLVDGGVFANNPTMCALVAAWRRYGSQHRFVVVSLGTGFLQRPIPLQEAKGWGIIGWARPILSVLMDGNTDTVSVQASEWLGTDHYRFDIALGVNAQDHHAANDDLDDASPGNIRALLAKADDLIATERERRTGCRLTTPASQGPLKRPLFSRALFSVDHSPPEATRSVSPDHDWRGSTRGPRLSERRLHPPVPLRDGRNLRALSPSPSTF
jgi:hypothetical protein